jgi:hypothetical protein
MSTENRSDVEHQGQDPTEEVTAEGCETQCQNTEVKAGALEETPVADLPKIVEEIFDAYQPEPEFMIPSPVDGMPIPADEGNDQPIAPPFTYDTVVCVGDDREYIELFTEEAFEASNLTLPGGKCETRERYLAGGKQTERMRFMPDRVEMLYGTLFVQLNEKEKTLWDSSFLMKIYIPVRPRREPCRYYARQILSNDGQPDPNEPGHKIIFRNCTMRRSVGGAFMSLRDEAIYACDYRDPPDPESVKHFLDDPDREKLRSEAHKVMLPLWRDPKSNPGDTK